MNVRPAPTTTIAAGLLVAMATLPLRSVFDDWGWAVSVIGAALAASLLASAIETLRPGAPFSVLCLATSVSAALWGLLVSLRGVFWAAPSSTAVWRDLGDGIFNGLGALLDDQTPLTDPQSAETFAAFVVWIAGATAVHVAARQRSALAAIAAGATVLGVSTAAALPHGLPPAIFGAAVGVLALFAIATLTRAPDQRWRVGRIVALASLIGTAGIVAAGAGLLATAVDRTPIDPRAARGTQTVEIVVPDILAEYGVRRTEDTSILTIESTAPPSGIRLRLQVYDQHDGERWVPAADFEEIATFPEAAELPPGDLLTMTIVLEELDGPWIPVPDRLTSIDLADVRWNEATQTMITDEQPARYDLTGSSVSRAELDGIDSAREEVDEQLRAVPAGLPDAIRTAAREATADTADDIGAIDAITDLLRTLGRDESRPPGNSFGRLRDDLDEGVATGAEQLASLHALMLRSVGVPSRVVVGYVANGPLVESADLQIWVEAPFPGIGWVAFNPVPTVIESGTEPAEDPTAPTTTQPQDAPLQARALPRELGPGEDPDEAEIGLDEPLTLGDGIVLAVLAAVGLLAFVLGLRLARRRFRRSSGWRAEVRVLGAWAEMVDRLRELGAPITATTTMGDVVYMATTMDDVLGEQTRHIADLAATALHAPVGSTPDEAATAWDVLRLAESRLVEVRGRRVVPRRYLDPRVLRYRAPKPPESRHGGRRSTLRPPSR